MTESEYEERKARAERVLIAMADLKPDEQEAYTTAVEGAAMMNRLVERFHSQQRDVMA